MSGSALLGLGRLEKFFCGDVLALVRFFSVGWAACRRGEKRGYVKAPVKTGME